MFQVVQAENKTGSLAISLVLFGILISCKVFVLARRVLVF